MPGTDARRRLALIAITLFLAGAPAAHAAEGDLDLVSRADGASGTSGDGSSQQPDVSQDGHLVAFTSAARNLTSDTVPTGVTEAYVRNLATNTTVLISRATGASGALSPTNVAQTAISDDGRYAVYAIQSGVNQVYLRDLQANTTTLVATDAINADLSGDGTTVAFCSNDNITGTGATGASRKVYVYDVATGAVQLVSRQNGAFGATMTGDTPSLSRDGNVVAFAGQGGTAQVWVRDRAAGTTVEASLAPGAQGAPANTAAIEPAISGNGRYVVFRSHATNLSDNDADNTDDIFERDLQANTTTLASRVDGATGAAADASSDLPAVSDDGTRVFFRSRATNLSSEDNSSGDNGFVRDTATGTTTWVHGAAHQTPAPQSVMDGLALSGDGRYAVFASGATLLPQETGNHGDVFRRDLGGPPPPPPLPSASISADQSIAEGGSGAVTPVGFTVTLSAPDARAIQVDWQTVANTASAGFDYRAASGQVSFAPGQTEAFISVDVLGDTVDEPDETFSVALSNPVDVTLARSVATVTIRDDDLPVLLPPALNPTPAPSPTGLPATSGPPATTCATQTTQGLAVLRGCIANGRMTGVVSVNGLTVDLGGNALVVEADRIASTGAVTISAGDVVINRGVNFNLDPKTGVASLTAPSGASLYGLTLEPKLALHLATGGVANVAGQVALLGAPVPMSFQASDADGLRRNTIKAAGDTVDFKRFVATSVALQFDPAAQLWRGSFVGRSVFPGIPQLKLAGTIDRSGTILFGGKPPSLGGLIKMRTATLSLIPSPLSIKGVLGYDVVPAFNLFSFDGSATYVFGANTFDLTGTAKLFGMTLGAPGSFNFGKLVGGLIGGGGPVGAVAAATLGNYTISGNQPLIFGTGVGDKKPPAPPPANVASVLGGGIGGVLDALSYKLNPFNGQFSGSSQGSFVLLGVTIGGSATVSEKGFAACGDIGFLHFGMGVTFSPFALTLMGPTTCDVGPWRATASSAQAGTKTLTLPAGVQVLRIHSTAPATLHGPGGQTVSTATAPQVGATAIVLKDDQFTYVALKNPKGTWTVDGAGAIDSAAQLAPAKVTAKVAKGRVRWTERVSPGQSVTLAEEGAGVYRELGTLHGAKGTLKLKPQGSGARTLVAIVNEGGVPVSRKVVARYTAPKPPKPGRPGKVTVKFAKATLTVSWKPARHAASYLVTVKTPNGTLFAAPKRRSAKLTDILPVTKASVTVTPVGATGARGPARTVSAKRRR